MWILVAHDRERSRARGYEDGDVPEKNERAVSTDTRPRSLDRERDPAKERTHPNRRSERIEEEGGLVRRCGAALLALDQYHAPVRAQADRSRHRGPHADAAEPRADRGQEV